MHRAIVATALGLACGSQEAPRVEPSEPPPPAIDVGRVLADARQQLETDPTNALATLATIPQAELTNAAREVAVEAVARGAARRYGPTPHAIAKISVAPDGMRALTVEQDGNVRLWDLGTAKPELLGRGGVMCAGFFPPDGSRIYEVQAKEVGIRTLADRMRTQISERYQPPREAPIFCTLNRGGGALAIFGGKLVELLNFTSSMPMEIEDSDHAGAVAFAPDGSLLAIESRGRMLLVPLATHQPRKLQSKLGIKSAIAFSPDGRRLAAAAIGGRVIEWSLPKLATRTFDSTGAGSNDLAAIAFAPDGELLAVSSGGRLHRWDAVGKHRAVELEHALEAVFATSSFVIARAKDRAIVIDRASQIRELRHPRLSAIAVLADDQLLTAGADGTLRRWELGKRDGVPESLSALHAWLQSGAEQ